MGIVVAQIIAEGAIALINGIPIPNQTKALLQLARQLVRWKGTVVTHLLSRVLLDIVRPIEVKTDPLKLPNLFDVGALVRTKISCDGHRLRKSGFIGFKLR